MGLSIEEVISNNIKTFIECFELTQENDGKLVYTCCVEGCRNKYGEKSSSIRHLKKNHNEVYKTIQCEKLAVKEYTTKSPCLFEIRVRVNPNDIMDACAELITVHGLPLSVIEYPAFKRLLNPYVIALELKGVKLSLTKKSIREHIKKRTNQVKETIRSETKNKMVSLMMDIASRYNRSVLGITIAYMHEGKVSIRTISMHVLKAAHTGSHIRNLVKDILADYGISLAQIVSITTDNGSNMIKAIALLDAFYQDLKAMSNKNEKEDEDEDDDDDEYFINADIFDEDYYRNVLNDAKSELESECSSDLIHGISCAAHCIDLVVKHAVKNSPEIVRILNKCRTLAKLLRTPKLRAKLKEANLNMAMLDVDTRWNSIYSMVKTD